MSRPRLAALALGAVLLGAARGALAVPLPAPVHAEAGPLRLSGEGEMRWFGLKIYDAALWTAGSPDAAPHALAIRYARAIPASRLVETSVDEIRRLGERDEQRLSRWRALLAAALPSVSPGDTLVGLHRPGRDALFWHQGRLTARIDDADLARAFFAIWLDERTLDPGLRARLLGGGSAR